MRNVSWGAEWLKKGHKRSSSSLAKAAAAEAVEGTGVVAEVSAGEVVVQATAKAEGTTAQPDAAPFAKELETAAVSVEETTLALPDTAVSNSVTPGSGTRSPATPAVKLADEVDPIALAEAMASMEALGQPEPALKTNTGSVDDGAESTRDVAAVRSLKEVYVGGGQERDTKAEVWSFQVSPIGYLTK